MSLSNSCSTLCAMVTASWAASLLWAKKDGTGWQPRLSTARVSSRRKSEHSRVKSEFLPGCQSFWLTQRPVIISRLKNLQVSPNICVPLTKVKGIRQRPVPEESHSGTGLDPPVPPLEEGGETEAQSGRR